MIEFRTHLKATCAYFRCDSVFRRVFLFAISAAEYWMQTLDCEGRKPILHSRNISPKIRITEANEK